MYNPKHILTSSLSKEAKLLLLYIGAVMIETDHRKNSLKISLNKLQSEIKISRPTVSKVINELEKKKFLLVIREKENNGCLVNEYKLLADGYLPF